MSRFGLRECVLVALVCSATTVHAQGIFEGLFDKATKSAEQKGRDQ